jgi:hypothetical protein
MLRQLARIALELTVLAFLAAALVAGLVGASAYIGDR